MRYLVLLALLSYCVLSHITFDKKLRFDENGNFKLVQITDLHYGDSEEQNNLTTRAHEKLLGYDPADLVVLTGDMVSDYAWDQTPDYYERHWKQWTAPLLKYKQPYVYALGNHDSGPFKTRKEIMALDVTHPYSLSEEGPQNITGGSNYVKAIWDSEGERVLLYIWIFDSNKEFCMGVTGWGCIEQD